MAKKSIVSIAHCDDFLGTPSNYTQEHVEKIKEMISSKTKSVNERLKT